MIIEDMTITTDMEEGKRLKITGSSLETILSRRIVWNKTVFKKTYKGDTTEVDTVPLLQDAIKQLLNENLISPAMASRKLENFVFDESTDKAITKLTIEAQYRGESIYDIVSTLCKENKIGFKVNTRFSDANIFDKSKLESITELSKLLDSQLVSPQYKEAVRSRVCNIAIVVLFMIPVGKEYKTYRKPIIDFIKDTFSDSCS